LGLLSRWRPLNLNLLQEVEERLRLGLEVETTARLEQQHAMDKVRARGGQAVEELCAGCWLAGTHTLQVVDSVNARLAKAVAADHALTGEMQQRQVPTAIEWFVLMRIGTNRESGGAKLTRPFRDARPIPLTHDCSPYRIVNNNSSLHPNPSLAERRAWWGRHPYSHGGCVFSPQATALAGEIPPVTNAVASERTTREMMELQMVCVPTLKEPLLNRGSP
jgi:hypothetical protein